MSVDCTVRTAEALPESILEGFKAAAVSRGVDPNTSLADGNALRAARQHAQGGDHHILKADALPPNTFTQMDQFIIRNGPELAPALMRLQRVSVPNPRGTSKVEIPRIGDVSGVREGLNPDDHGASGRLDVDTQTVAVPYHYIHMSFDSDLEESWQPYMGEAITQGQRALLLWLEQRIYVGTGKYSGAQGFGFNHDQVATIATTDEWNASATTGAQRKDDVLAVISALADAKRSGAISVFLHPTADALLGDDYSGSYARTIRDRLNDMVASIEPSTGIQTATNVYFVVPGDGTCRLAMPIQPTVHTWLSPSSYRRHVIVVARMCPAFVTAMDGSIAARIVS